MEFIYCLCLCFSIYQSIAAEDIVIKKHSEIPLLHEAPVWLKPCRRKDPKLNECLRDTFQNMFPWLAKGIPEIGTQALEPMHIEKVAISKGQGAVTLHGAFNNLIVHGPSNTTALYTRIDFKRGKLDIGLFIPIIKVDAKYDLKGNILLLPLVGVGDAKLYLKNVTTHVSTRIHFPKYQDEEVMVASTMKVEFSLAIMRVHLSNLFNGNQVLGRTVNTFLNENAKEVVNELKENIGESLSGVFKKIMNDAFSHIPTKLWLIEDSTNKTISTSNGKSQISTSSTSPSSVSSSTKTTS